MGRNEASLFSAEKELSNCRNPFIQFSVFRWCTRGPYPE